MSTSAVIAVHTNFGYTFTYLGGDGHIEECGRVLKQYYNDSNKALQLVSQGEISLLKENIDCPDGHSFNNRVPGYCVFYARDRGDKTQSNFNSSIDDIALCSDDIDYVYVYMNEWLLAVRNGNELNLVKY